MSTLPQIYMGIDPGIADVGYGVVAIIHGKETCLAYGSIRTKAGERTELRLKQVYDELTEILEKYKPNHVSIEKLYFQKNVKTAITVAEARGVIRLAVESKGIPCNEYNPSDVKIAVCGHGGADKSQVQKMVCSLLNLEEIPKPDDAADALALALTLSTSKKFIDATSQ